MTLHLIQQAQQAVFTFPELYDEIKYWGPFVGAMVGLYKLLDWIKTQSKAADDIKASMTTMNFNMNRQTDVIVEQLKEMRSDLRTFASLAVTAATAPTVHKLMNH